MPPFTAGAPAVRTPGIVPGEKRAGPSSTAATPRWDADEEKLRAAIKPFATSGDKTYPVENLPAIVQGIITHYVEPGRRGRLKEQGDSLRLIEDLGLDSLTMMEIMIRVEDMLDISVTDAELRHFRTLGEVRQFIERTARDRAAPVSSPLPAT